MAARDIPGVEYFDKKIIRGGETHKVKTLSIVMYAPDGSIFLMPHGGNPMTYIAKGYLFVPNEDWHEKHRNLEESNATSLKISDFQREIGNRTKEVARKKAQADILTEMHRLDAEMQAAEDALATPPQAAEVAPQEVISEAVDPAPAPKPKAKAKVNAKVKA
jgi:hypothetical protein